MQNSNLWQLISVYCLFISFLFHSKHFEKSHISPKTMDVHQTKSTKRRHREYDKNARQKKHRIDELPDDADQKMRIVDLNDDCLAKIFRYLNLESLLNISMANKWLAPAAADTFKRRYGKKEVLINECDDFHPNMSDDAYEVRAPKERTTNIAIYGLKASLLYLRYFGASIENLTIDYYKSTSIRYGFIHQYISTYCTTSLTCMSFMHLPGASMQNFEKTFKNVRRVIVRDSDLGEQLTSCGKWFPKMNRLKLTNVRLADDFDATSFQHLKHLCICLDEQVGLKMANIPQLLQQSRRLRSFEIEAYHKSIPMIMLLDMIKNHSRISKLDIRMLGQYSKSKVVPSEVQRLVTEHSSLVKLHLPHYQFQTDDVIALTCQHKTVKSFRFRMKNSANYAELESKLDKTIWTLTKVYDWDSEYVKLNRKK